MRERDIQTQLQPRVLAAAVLTIVLAGCGIAGQSPSPVATTTAAPPTAQPSATSGQTAGPTDEPTQAPSATPPPAITGQVTFGNWPAYIDIDEDGGGYPTLAAFTEQTGIEVSYQEDINDNTEFFGKIQPDLAAGRSTGYDVIAPSDWMIAKLIRLGYLQPLDKSLLPNFTANAADSFLDPWYDPGNQYSIPWQAGLVGIGYNPTLTGREITSFADLLDPEFAGRVGLFSEMIDTMSLALLANGVHPADATLEDAQAAQQMLLEAAERGQFRAFYGNDYYDALAAGNLALTIAWSGDISQMQLWDNPDVRFVVPSEGGLMFVDNMVIPNNVEHLGDAYALMDYWYSLDAAVQLTEYIGYYSPVMGVQDRILADSDAARADGDTEWADQLLQIAHDSVPTPEQLQNIFPYKQLTEDEERAWNDLFNVVVNG
jgi:spermidine/putrescine transport system substrate-binding protein